MKREIKFRGLTTGEAPTWVYGCLVNNLWTYSEHSKFPNGSPVSEIITGKYKGDCWEDIAAEEDGIVTVLTESVGQFTGLWENAFEEVNLNKEIYEGDIIEFIDGSRAAVEWNDDICQWQFSDGTPINDGDRYATHKAIIGNIYENPELLQEVEKGMKENKSS